MLTSRGVRRHSRPAFLKGPTSSRCLASTLMTAHPFFRKVSRVALMISNCLLRSGDCRIERLFRFPRSEYLEAFSFRCTLEGLMSMRARFSIFDTRRAERRHHFKCDAGSPAVASSTAS